MPTRRPSPALFALPFALAFLCLFLCRADPANGDDLTTTAGKKLTGKVIAIDAQGVTFLAGESRVTVPGKDLVLVELGNKVAPLPRDKDGRLPRVNEVELIDGSTLRAGKVLVKGRKVEAEMLAGPEGLTAPKFSLPLEVVFSVMRGAEEPKNREAWKKMLVGRGRRDLYVVREADGLNFVQGTILGGDETGTKLNFEREDGTRTELLLSRATGGLVFSPPPAAQVPPTLCKVIDVFGNTLVAREVRLSPGGVTVVTVAGVEVNYPSIAAVAKLDYAQGNIAYLSDLDPVIDAPELPAEERALRLNPAPPVVRDAGISNEPLRFGNDPVLPKGLVIATDTALTFNLGGEYRELKALIGMAETSPDAGLEAKVMIEVDGKVVFSETVRRKDKPRPVSIDVKGANQLRVIVEADSPQFGNRIVLADARVQK